ASRIIEAFVRLYQKGYVYKGKKTVFWCASCETALAQAEVEYAQKSSPSIYVAFDVALPQEKADAGYALLIWTTTPWTLPANRAVAVKPDGTYVALKGTDGKKYIVLAELADKVSALLGTERTSESYPATTLTTWKVKSPLADQDVPILPDPAVSIEDGTGLVHTAPGHGAEDFALGQRFGLEAACPVDGRGLFTEDTPFQELLHKSVTHPDTTRLLFSLLGKRLLKETAIQHSYPHCWRCKKPIIYRATPQWFLNMEHKRLRAEVIKAIGKTGWLPEASQERIKSMVETRPDWCLSRQRLWGAPIPILYCQACGDVNDTPGLFEHILAEFRVKGEDFWFAPDGAFLADWGQRFPCPKCKGKELLRDPNILDVWMDSGVSWLAVCKSNDTLTYPADFYLEGTDQHRGWFQTSIITAVALTGQAPYKTVFTNGWVLDDQGRAMHKSLGNVVSPQDIIKQWGADILRLWAASTESLVDVRVSPRLMDAHAENYKKIRNTIRYMLGNLCDFKPHGNGIKDLADLERLERYPLAKLNATIAKVNKAYTDNDFPGVLRALLDFSVHDLSNFYFDISKDRLYTFAVDDPDRRATQSVLFTILHCYVRMLAPILPFTAEEAWQRILNIMDCKDPLTLCGIALDAAESVHLTRLPQWQKPWENAAIVADLDMIGTLRTTVNQRMDVMRKEGVLGSSLEAQVTLTVPQSKYHTLASWEGLLPTIFIASEVVLAPGDKIIDDAIAIDIAKAKGNKCQRCWIYHECVGDDAREPGLCSKCIHVLFPA
ncbi:MAG: isoleucine--tRNA ligase, partial [Elusimicrobiota bacterium]